MPLKGYKAHKTLHQDGGSDEVSVAALSGELADRQKSKCGNSTLGWTDEKLLKGAGAGVAPDEIDVPAGAALPSGCIVIWTGTIANIPSGYVICDGNNSTPNLLAKFIEGVATAATNPGATGGATAKTLDLGPLTGGAGISHVNYVASAGAEIKCGNAGTSTYLTTTKISDIRPLYYDVAFIMKT